jgi:hypothetical protein
VFAKIPRAALENALERVSVLIRHSFVMPEAVAKGELRPLRNPADDPD